MNKNDKFLFYLGLAVFVLQLMNGLIAKTFLTGWIYALFWFIVLIVQKKNVVPQKTILYFTIFFLGTVVYLLRGGTYSHWNSGWKLLSFFVGTLFPFAFSCFLLEKCNRKAILATICLLLGLMIFFTFSTRVILETNKDLLRLAVNDENLRISLERLGLCSYALPHAAPFIVPAIIYAMKNSSKRIYKMVCLIVLFFDFWLISISGAATPMLLYFVAILISLLISQQKTIKQNITRMAVIGLIMLPLFNDNVLLSIMSPLEDITMDTPFYSKVIDIESSIVSQDTEGSLDKRMEKYDMTFSTLSTHFVFGTTDASLLGGHAYFVDAVASVGLFAIFLFCFIFSMYKNMKNKLSPSAQLYFTAGFFVYIIECCVKNIDAFEYYTFLFALAPAIMCYVDQKNEESQLITK